VARRGREGSGQEQELMWEIKISVRSHSGLSQCHRKKNTDKIRKDKRYCRNKRGNIPKKKNENEDEIQTAFPGGGTRTGVSNPERRGGKGKWPISKISQREDT
jgi:hypothetical protein